MRAVFVSLGLFIGACSSNAELIAVNKRSILTDNNRRLRSGLKTDVYVMNAVKEDVMRIANASYYVGRGEYELFVRNSDKEIVKRKVQLGDSNFEFVEVVSGLQPGDEVVVSDMSNYKNKNKLKLK
jgi:HlyD family secretion protein